MSKNPAQNTKKDFYTKLSTFSTGLINITAYLTDYTDFTDFSGGAGKIGTTAAASHVARTTTPIICF